MADDQDKTPEKPLLETVAATGDGYRGLGSAFVGNLRMPKDTTLFKLGGAEYKRMLRDDQVQSTFQQRRLAVIARDWSVTPGGDAPRDREAAEYLSKELMRIGWDRVTNDMLFGIFYGYSVAEALWEIRDGKVGIAKIKVRERLRFRFDKEARLRLLKTGGNPDGEIMPPAKFWTFRAGGDHDDEAYGLGLGYYLFWPVWFKREGLKSWLQGLDKTARPTARGKFPPGATAEDIEKLLATLQAMASDTGIAIPETMEVELLQAARSATADYDTLYRRMDAAIAKIVLSQTMTTDSASTGLGSTQGDVHADVKQEVVKADVDLLNESFSGTVAKWLTEWNFPGAEIPIVSRQVDDPEDLDAASDRDTKLYQMGWQPTEERIREVYGEGYERRPNFGEPPNLPTDTAAATDFASAAEAQDPVDGLSEMALQDWEEVMTPLIEPLRNLVENADSLEEIRDSLIERLDGMDDAAFTERLARSGFNIRIAGRSGAIDDEQ